MPAPSIYHTGRGSTKLAWIFYMFFFRYWWFRIQFTDRATLFRRHHLADIYMIMVLIVVCTWYNTWVWCYTETLFHQSSLVWVRGIPIYMCHLIQTSVLRLCVHNCLWFLPGLFTSLTFWTTQDAWPATCIALFAAYVFFLAKRRGWYARGMIQETRVTLELLFDLWEPMPTNNLKFWKGKCQQ